MDSTQDSREREAQALRQRMARGTATIALQRVVETLIGLILVPVMLHYLGTVAYGYWALIYAVVVYLNLTDMGFAASFNHFFVNTLESGDSQEKRVMFSSALSYQLVIAVVVLVIGLAAENGLLRFFTSAQELGMAARWAWRAMLLILILGFIGSYARSLFYATHRVAQLGALNIVLALLNAVAVVVVLTRQGGLIGLAAVAASIAVLRVSLVFGFGSRGVPGFSLSPDSIDLKVIGRLWRFGLRVLVTRITEVIHVYFDRLLLGRVSGMQVVALYDVGAKAASTAQQVPMVMWPVIEPEAARFQAQGESAKLHLLATRTSRYAALVAFPLLTLLISSAKPLLTLWLGEQLKPGMVLATTILAGAYLSMGVTTPLRYTARGVGKPGWDAKSSIVQAVANVILSITLYFKFGFTGVLMGTLLATLVGQGLFLTMVFPGLGLKAWSFFWMSWIRPGVSAILSGAASWSLLRWVFVLPESGGRGDAVVPAIASVVVFAVVYAVAIFVTHSTDRNEAKLLLNALRGRRNKNGTA